MALFNFQNFFTIFLEFSFMRNVGSERNDKFLESPCLILVQHILARNGAIMVFLNFLAFFLKFSITRCVGTKQNDNSYLLSFSAFSNLFWL